MYNLRTRKFLANAFSVLSSDVVNRAALFAIYALVSRKLGSYSFGQLSLAFTLLSVFQVFAVAGTKTLITRDIARERSSAATIMGTGLVLVAALSACSFAGLVVFARLMHYSRSTETIIILLGFSLLPFAVSAVLESVFQAFEHMQYIAYASVPLNLARIIGVGVVLMQGFQLPYVVMVILVSQCAIAGAAMTMLFFSPIWPGISFRLGLIPDMLRRTRTLLGVDTVFYVFGSINLVLLSKLVGITETGIYNAATQILVPVTLVMQNAVRTAFPAMCNAAKLKDRLRQITTRLLEGTLAVAIPAAVALFFLAQSVLVMLYGRSDFGVGANALKIMGVALIANAFTFVLGQALIADLRERTTLKIVSLVAILNVALAVILIRAFGLVGAAGALLASRAIDAALHVAAARNLFSSKITSGLAITAAATCCMVAVLIGAHEQQLLVQVLSAGALYIAVFFLLAFSTIGGYSIFRENL